MHDKYVAFAQELVVGMPAAVQTLREVAATEPAVSYLIGLLRLRGKGESATQLMLSTTDHLCAQTIC